MIRLFVMFMWCWGMGAFFFTIIAISDWLFTLKWRPLLRRLPLVAVWPLAMITQRGRNELFAVFQQTQR